MILFCNTCIDEMGRYQEGDGKLSERAHAERRRYNHYRRHGRHFHILLSMKTRGVHTPEFIQSQAVALLNTSNENVDLLETVLLHRRKLQIVSQASPEKPEDALYAYLENGKVVVVVQ